MIETKYIIGGLLIFSPFIAHFLYNLYWMLKCIVFGGDYKPYFIFVLGYVFSTAVIAGIAIVTC